MVVARVAREARVRDAGKPDKSRRYQGSAPGWFSGKQRWHARVSKRSTWDLHTLQLRNLPDGQFFARVVKTIQSAIAAVVGVVAGGSILSPSFARREESWLPVGPSLGALIDNAPTPATLRVAREDGYNQVVERRVVLLVKTGEGEVTALDPTCTHLGCRVSWDSEAKELRCPCHGGSVRSPRRRQGRAAARATADGLPPRSTGIRFSSKSDGAPEHVARLARLAYGLAHRPQERCSRNRSRLVSAGGSSPAAFCCCC